MDCPYCHKEMQKGVIPGDRIPVCWEPEDYDPWSDGVTERGVRLSPPAFITPRAEAWYCAECRIVIAPVREFEKTADKIARKWNSFTEKMQQIHDAAQEKHEARRREKKTEQRRKKDPWEIE